jgi:hypothetical protein
VKLLIMQFSPASRYSLTSVSTLFCNTLSRRSSLNVRDRISHVYTMTGEIIIVYVLIFTSLENRLEDKRF